MQHWADTGRAILGLQGSLEDWRCSWGMAGRLPGLLQGSGATGAIILRLNCASGLGDGGMQGPLTSSQQPTIRH
jgi:hypothetical protein